jgi:hypothetical protein
LHSNIYPFIFCCSYGTYRPVRQMGFRFLLSEICYILVEISACRKHVPKQNTESTKNTYILHVRFASRIRIHDYSTLAVEESTYVKTARLLKSVLSGMWHVGNPVRRIRKYERNNGNG